jgi:hypothetical protein
VSVNSSYSGHTIRQTVSPRIQDDCSEYFWPDEEEKRAEEAITHKSVTFEQLREYDKLVTQLIKD